MPRKIFSLYRGKGTSPVGGGLKRAGMGRRKGGSMIHERRRKVAQLNKIIKTAQKKPNTSKNRASATKKLKDWAKSAHKVATKYGLYSKGKNLVGSYLKYRSSKGSSNRIGYTPQQRISLTNRAIDVD